MSLFQSSRWFDCCRRLKVSGNRKSQERLRVSILNPPLSKAGTEHKEREKKKKKERDESDAPSCTFPHIRIQATRRCLVEILKHTDRAAIDDRALTRRFKSYASFCFPL